MLVGVPKEIKEGEKRVALTPESVKNIVQNGFSVAVEAGAGEGAYHFDGDYLAAGAVIEGSVRELYKKADIVIKIHKPDFNDETKAHEIDMIREGAALVALLYPLTNPDLIKRLQERRIKAFSLDLIPRTAAAQPMDVLSSMGTVAGYVAAITAASRLPRFFPMLMTAAGTIPPAKVLIIGAGVAGLQACATARRLGAVTEVFDQRPKVKEEVESLGAKFIEVPTEEATQTEAGYARELSEAYRARQAEAIKRHVAKSDVVITTALVPGKRAPVLVTGEMVKGMRPGSVIVDLAADFGGNCELTEPGKEVSWHGVLISGRTDVLSLMPVDSSRMFSRNAEKFLLHIAGRSGLRTELDDEIIKATFVTKEAGPIKNL